MSLRDYDRSLDPPDDVEICELHGCVKAPWCIECYNDELDRRDEARRDRYLEEE